MTPRIISLLAVTLALTGCATDGELSEKEKNRIAREMAKEEQKQVNAQAKAMRETNTGVKTPKSMR
jgi:type III secretory pathway lipoprotein EscJ